MSSKNTRKIDYAGSVHDEREIEAVVEVLRGGPTALRIGKVGWNFEPSELSAAFGLVQRPPAGCRTPTGSWSSGSSCPTTIP